MIEYEAHIDTYTVYDQYGHVSCVIPPAAADQMTMSGSYAETSSPLATCFEQVENGIKNAANRIFSSSFLCIHSFFYKLPLFISEVG